MAAADAALAPAAKRSDLPLRTATAAIMLAVAGGALWLGGIAWLLFVFAVGGGVLFEWRVLVLLAARRGWQRTLWNLAGLVYCGAAITVLLLLRSAAGGVSLVLTVLLAVIGTDVGAYFAGRTFGGPKIAPSISPSKTWSGLAGGIVGASVAVALAGTNQCIVETPATQASHWAVCARTMSAMIASDPARTLLPIVLSGVAVAVIAQAGDFFESWMKRRAGVKDSGKLLPGHGGLFDRVDGLLSVLFVLGILFVIGRVA